MTEQELTQKPGFCTRFLFLVTCLPDFNPLSPVTAAKLSKIAKKHTLRFQSAVKPKTSQGF